MDGQTLRQWRTSHGIGVRQLARLLGIDPSTVVRWERGDRRPPGRLLERALADVERETGQSSVAHHHSDDIMDELDAIHARLVASGWVGEDVSDALAAVRDEREIELSNALA